MRTGVWPFLMKEHYRLAQPALQPWTPEIPEWPKIVEAATPRAEVPRKDKRRYS